MSVEAPVSHFPNIPSVLQAKTYDAIMKRVDAKRDDLRKFSGTPALIAAATKQAETACNNWKETAVTNLNRAEINALYWPLLDQYLSFQRARDVVGASVKVYNQVLSKCPRPAMDASTLTALQRLKVKVTDIKAAYDRVFTTELNKLTGERDRMQGLFSRLFDSLKTLRLTLEPLASQRSPDYVWPTQSWHSPYLNRDVIVRIAEKAKNGRMLVKPAEAEAAEAEVAVAQADAKSYFPDIPETKLEETFEALMKRASDEYAAKYQGYQAVADGTENEMVTLKATVEDWQKEEVTNENRGKIDADYYPRLIAFMKLQDTCAAVTKTLELYNRTINECAPPVLDSATLNECQKLGIDIKPFKESYDAAFTVKLNKLKGERDALQKLHTKLSISTVDMEMVLEPLASKRSPNTLWVSTYVARDVAAEKAKRAVAATAQ